MQVLLAPEHMHAGFTCTGKFRSDFQVSEHCKYHEFFVGRQLILESDYDS